MFLKLFLFSNNSWLRSEDISPGVGLRIGANLGIGSKDQLRKFAATVPAFLTVMLLCWSSQQHIFTITLLEIDVSAFTVICALANVCTLGEHAAWMLLKQWLYYHSLGILVVCLFVCYL